MKEDDPNPFTAAGKVLFLFTLLIVCGGIAWVFLGLLPRMPSGSYPVFYLFGPILVAAALFFFGVAAFLRRRGIAVFVSEKDQIQQLKKERGASDSSNR